MGAVRGSWGAGHRAGGSLHAWNLQNSPKRCGLRAAHLPERQDEQGQEQETSEGASQDDPDGNLRLLGLGDLKCDLGGEEKPLRIPGRDGAGKGTVGMLSTPSFGNAAPRIWLSFPCGIRRFQDWSSAPATAAPSFSRPRCSAWVTPALLLSAGIFPVGSGQGVAASQSSGSHNLGLTWRLGSSSRKMKGLRKRRWRAAFMVSFSALNFSCMERAGMSIPRGKGAPIPNGIHPNDSKKEVLN